VSSSSWYSGPSRTATLSQNHVTVGVGTPPRAAHHTSATRTRVETREERTNARHGTRKHAQTRRATCAQRAATHP
jgi:hypothetical protein